MSLLKTHGNFPGHLLAHFIIHFRTAAPSTQHPAPSTLAPGFLGDILDRLTGVASLAFASDFCRCDF